MPRFYCPPPLSEGLSLDLPAGAARHVQVLRMQPGDRIVLFDGKGGEYGAGIEQMGRSTVRVQVLSHDSVEREAVREVHLALGMPANERMDWLLEKATELGAASFQPLVTERGVVRLAGERAVRKQEHWAAIATAACEQSGRNRIPEVHALTDLPGWLKQRGVTHRLILSLQAQASPLAAWRAQHPEGGVCLLSGPEGGLSPREEESACREGFIPVSLGLRTLRAETAPLAALAALTL